MQKAGSKKNQGQLLGEFSYPDRAHEARNRHFRQPCDFKWKHGLKRNEGCCPHAVFRYPAFHHRVAWKVVANGDLFPHRAKNVGARFTDTGSQAPNECYQHRIPMCRGTSIRETPKGRGSRETLITVNMPKIIK